MVERLCSPKQLQRPGLKSPQLLILVVGREFWGLRCAVVCACFYALMSKQEASAELLPHGIMGPALSHNTQLFLLPTC